MLAAITCHFNPIDYDNLLRNYWMFREDLPGGVDLFTIELSFNDEFAIPDSFVKIASTPRHIMWQKERLLNALIERLPAKYDKIAWIDADVLFDNKDWATEAESKLNHYPMVQLFENGCETDSELELVGNKIPGIVRGGVEIEEALPGRAWAARREVLQKTGLLDTHIMGGGDIMMYYAAMGMFTTFMLTRTNIEWRRSYLRWAGPFYRAIKGKVGYVSGDITHLYHGTYADRQYVERWIILSRARYNPEEDIRINNQGIWEWNSDKPDLHDAVANYFEERKEDEKWIASLKSQGLNSQEKPEQTLPGLENTAVTLGLP
jgi:hypothetical protein